MSSMGLPPGRALAVDGAVSIRRLANDEVARVASRFDADEGNRFEFICECDDLNCRRAVWMTVAEYRASSPGAVVGHSVPANGKQSRRAAPPDVSRSNLRHVRDSIDGEQEWEFSCQCVDENCHQPVFLTFDAYIALRDHGRVVLANRHRASTMNALRQANAVRSARARLKQDLREGAVCLEEIIAAAPHYAATAKVVGLLVAVPNIGPVKAARILTTARVTHMKTIGELSDRQRGRLIELLSPVH